MPELELCAYCEKPIKPEHNSVKVEPAAQDSRDFGKPIYEQHAHVECYELMCKLERD